MVKSASKGIMPYKKPSTPTNANQKSVSALKSRAGQIRKFPVEKPPNKKFGDENSREALSQADTMTLMSSRLVPIANIDLSPVRKCKKAIIKSKVIRPV